MDINNSDLPERVEAQRIYLRHYQKGDGAVLYAAGLRNKEHLSRYESENFLLGLEHAEHAEKVIQELSAGWADGRYFFYGIFEKETDVWVGQIYIGAADWDLPAFNIGYIADVNYQGLGYISEAVKAVARMLFDDLGAHRLQADCNETNTRSWLLLERCGFIREGHLRDNKINLDGSFHGDYVYGLLRSDSY